MEWYLGNEDVDLDIPKDEIFDRLPSSDTWPLWADIVGNYNQKNKLNVLGVEELLSTEQMFFRRQQSTCAHEHSNVQLNDLPKIEEADDIFFDSLFEGEGDRSDSSANTTPTSGRNDAMEVDFSNHIRDSTYDVLNIDRFPPKKELEAEIYMMEEQSDLCEDISDYTSMEEPVLLELQNLSHQLEDTTRICLRDSLYRLAENSRYQAKCSQIGEDDMKNYKPMARFGPSRLQESKTKESDSNAIDRTVATLLFTTMDFCNSNATSTSGLDGDALQREYQTNPYVYYPGSSTPYLSFVGGGDAEVPTFDFVNQQLPQPSHSFFSMTPVTGS